MERRRELLDELAPYRLEEGAEHPWTGYSTPERTPGGMVSRWNAKKDLTFELLDPKLVVEVAYDHMEGRRFRHTAQFRRWRYDRDPSSCTYAQIERPVVFDGGDILAGGGVPVSGARWGGRRDRGGRGVPRWRAMWITYCRQWRRWASPRNARQQECRGSQWW